MVRIIITMLVIMLTACSVDYGQHLDKEKTRLPFTNIELRLPKILSLTTSDSNYSATNRELRLSIHASDAGYSEMKNQFLEVLRSNNTKKGGFSEKSYVPITDIGLEKYEYQTKSGEGVQDYNFIHKYNDDGFVSVRFYITRNDGLSEDMLEGIVKASLKTLTFTQSPVNLQEGLAYSVNDIKGMTIYSRLDNETYYDKNGMQLFVVSRTLIEQEYLSPYRAISPQVFADDDYHGRRCDKIITERSEELLVSSTEARKTLLSQKCRKRTHKAISTNIFMEGSVLNIHMALPKDKEHEEYLKFYDEFLEHFSLNDPVN